MKRGALRQAGGTASERASSVEEFCRQLGQMPILEACTVSGELVAGDTTVLVPHPLGRAPFVALLGSLSTVAALVPLDPAGTRLVGGDPAREVAVATGLALGTDVTFTLLVF